MFLRKSKPKKEPPIESYLEYRPRVFYIIFCHSPHWFSPFLKKGFSHCYVIERLEFLYMMFDPTRHGLNVMMPNCSSEHPLVENMMLLDPGLRVVKVAILGNDKPLVFRPKLLTCVSTLEYITGVSFGFWGALTPWSFFKALKKANHPNIISSREMTCQQEENKQTKPQHQPCKPPVKRVSLGHSQRQG